MQSADYDMTYNSVVKMINSTLVDVRDTTDDMIDRSITMVSGGLYMQGFNVSRDIVARLRKELNDYRSDTLKSRNDRMVQWPLKQIVEIAICHNN